MPTEMKGRRVPLGPGVDPYTVLKEPGDYCYLPPSGLATVKRVWFYLPIAKDQGVPAAAKTLHHIQSPPHRIIEEPDGSLTIRESIGAGPPNYYWHGFLTEGRWELSKSKP